MSIYWRVRITVEEVQDSDNQPDQVKQVAQALYSPCSRLEATLIKKVAETSIDEGIKVSGSQSTQKVSIG